MLCFALGEYLTHELRLASSHEDEVKLRHRTEDEFLKLFLVQLDSLTVIVFEEKRIQVSR